MDFKSFAYGYNAGARKSGGNVSQAELEAAIKEVVPEWALKEEPPKDAVTSVNDKTGAVKLNASDVGARPSTWMPTAADVRADPVGTAEAEIKNHNTDNAAHEYIQQRIDALRTLVENFLDIDDESFDQLSEILRDIQANTSALELMGTNKVDKTAISTSMTDSNPEHVASMALIVALDNVLTVVEQAIEDLKTNKQTAEQVSAAINNALSGYLTSVKAAELYQPKGDYLTREAGDARYAKPSDIPTVPTKVSQLSNDSGYLTPTTGDQRYPAKKATEDTLAEHGGKIAQLEEALANSMVEFAESVEWLEANGDKDRTYYLPDGYEYKYSSKYVEIPHNANTGDGDYLNVLPSGTWGNTAGGTQNGEWVSPVIPIDPTKMAPVGNPTQSRVTISGFDKVVPAYGNRSVAVWYYKSNGQQIMMKSGTDFASLPTNGEISTPFSFNLKDTNTWADSNWATVYGVRIGLGISASAITEEDIKNVVVNIPFLDFKGYKDGWYSTGKLHSDDPVVQENANNIAILRGDVDGLTDEVNAIKESAGSVTINTGEVAYFVGDSITYGTNVGTTKEECNANAWPAHLIALNGYDAVNSKNLGISGIGYCTTASGKTVRGVVDGQSFAGADIVTVAIGINDWKNSSATVENFFTEMYYCLNKIRTDNPYCRIFYILPFNFKVGEFASFYALGFKGEGNTALCYGNTLQQFVNLMKAKFEEDNFKALNVHVIDMTKTPAITRYNLTTTLGDGLHPTAECHKELAKEISRRIINT